MDESKTAIVLSRIGLLIYGRPGWTTMAWLALPASTSPQIPYRRQLVYYAERRQAGSRDILEQATGSSTGEHVKTKLYTKKMQEEKPPTHQLPLTSVPFVLSIISAVCKWPGVNPFLLIAHSPNCEEIDSQSLRISLMCALLQIKHNRCIIGQTCVILALVLSTLFISVKASSNTCLLLLGVVVVWRRWTCISCWQ